MSSLHSFLWLIPALPLAASITIAFFGPRLLRANSHWPCILACLLSCALSFLTLAAVIKETSTEDSGPHAAGIIQDQPVGMLQANHSQKTYYTWFQAGTVDVGLAFRADPLTAIMLVTITFIGTLIAIFSVGYMHGDEGYPRFFAEIALFIFSMTGLVLADNFLLLYAFWEGVGLCSYLLIGFWFARPAAAAAARKAFLVTRLGDFGFLLGIFTLWAGFGHALDYDTVFARAHDNPSLLTVACLLLFCGAVGKSAQFPLHVWLPDAMEGPTPVSALIHAATMVTAGVYMVARCMPLFQQVPLVLVIVSGVGTFTALLAGLIALTQYDLKRVLAYSTVSQLGYMFLALGSANHEALVAFAVTAAIFHLFTHAFFKALLFLASGSVMHAMGNVIDMRRFGGLRHRLETTHWTFLCGAMSLAGVPLLSGFWSKDDILSATLGAAQEGHPHAGWYALFFVVALVTAFLTAFYTFRAYFMTFWGKERIPPEAGHHAHESPPVMLWPLIILASGAVGAGIVVEPFTHWFSRFLGRLSFMPTPVDHPVNLALMAASGVVALAGIGLAWWIYAREPGLAGRLAAGFGGLYQLSLNKFHFDEVFEFFLVRPVVGFAKFCKIIDLHGVDSLVDLVAHVPRLIGGLFRPMQNGLVQFYALAMVLGLTVFLIALARALGG
jgi:NADH-quinone oxidoreductase subunit L